jgi:hypothetical protein
MIKIAKSMQKALSLFQQSSLSFKIHAAASFAILLLVMYLSTGTLSPLANTVDFPPDYPLVEPKCHYLFNGDYYQHAALYYLVKGKPKQSWEFTMHLRRILYNLLAYPFMKLFQFDIGGLITNALLTILAFLSFALFTLKTTGETGAIAGLWLLALFPGIPYFVGQPFLYAMIVPSCLWMYMLLWKLDKYASAEPLGNGRRSFFKGNAFLRPVLFISIAIGIFFLAYDFIVFFGTAVVLVLVWRKKWRAIPFAFVGMLLATGLWWAVVHIFLKSSFASQNTVFYTNVLQSYFSTFNSAQWLDVLKKLPELIIVNFFFSCFFFLPMLFLFSVVIGHKKNCIQVPEACVLMSVALVFMFNNCAPPYDKPWQMRGDWIARLYEPMFVVLLFYCVRIVQNVTAEKHAYFRKYVMYVVLVIAVAGNGIVSFGPALNDPAGISSLVYWKFYKHAPRETMKKNLEKYGRRPWGFCK